MWINIKLKCEEIARLCKEIEHLKKCTQLLEEGAEVSGNTIYSKNMAAEHFKLEPDVFIRCFHTNITVLEEDRKREVKELYAIIYREM